MPLAGSAAVAAALAPQLFPLLQLAGCEEAAAATLAAGCVTALTRLLPNDIGGGLSLLLVPAASYVLQLPMPDDIRGGSPLCQHQLHAVLCSRHTLAGLCSMR